MDAIEGPPCLAPGGRPCGSFGPGIAQKLLQGERCSRISANAASVAMDRDAAADRLPASVGHALYLGHLRRVRGAAYDMDVVLLHIDQLGARHDESMRDSATALVVGHSLETLRSYVAIKMRAVRSRSALCTQALACAALAEPPLSVPVLRQAGSEFVLSGGLRGRGCEHARLNTRPLPKNVSVKRHALHDFGNRP